MPLNSLNRDGCIFTLSLDETGQILASSNHIHNIEIWDIKERKIKKVLNDHKEIVTGIEFFNKDNYSKNDFYYKNKINLKDLKYLNKNNEEFFLSKHNQESINNLSNLENYEILNKNDNQKFDSDNLYMMSCSLDKTIKLWKDFNCIHTFLDHNDWVRCLSISNDNKYFLSGCVSSIIKYWDLYSQKVLFSFNNTNNNSDLLNTVNSLNFMSNNSNIFMSGLRNGAVKIFDVRNPTNLVTEFKAHKFKLNSVKFNKDDKFILSSGRDSLVRLWDFRKLPVLIL